MAQHEASACQWPPLPQQKSAAGADFSEDAGGGNDGDDDGDESGDPTRVPIEPLQCPFCREPFEFLDDALEHIAMRHDADGDLDAAMGLLAVQDSERDERRAKEIDRLSRAAALRAAGAGKKKSAAAAAGKSGKSAPHSGDYGGSFGGDSEPPSFWRRMSGIDAQRAQPARPPPPASFAPVPSSFGKAGSAGPARVPKPPSGTSRGVINQALNRAGSSSASSSAFSAAEAALSASGVAITASIRGGGSASSASSASVSRGPSERVSIVAPRLASANGGGSGGPRSKPTSAVQSSAPAMAGGCRAGAPPGGRVPHPPPPGAAAASAAARRAAGAAVASHGGRHGTGGAYESPEEAMIRAAIEASIASEREEKNARSAATAHAQDAAPVAAAAAPGHGRPVSARSVWGFREGGGWRGVDELSKRRLCACGDYAMCSAVAGGGCWCIDSIA